MAKRKRLTPANSDYLSAAPEAKSAPLGLNAAPIAQVAGEASATAALAEVTEVLQSARAEGRMIEVLPLEVIDERHLVRDRLEQNEEEMVALIESLRSRGQQMPIEVVRLPGPVDDRTHGLISGWRRLTALKRLYKETSDPKFAHVKAMVVAPESAQDAYVAMVEENEIRVNLSHYERARIVVKAIEEGVYPDQRSALRGLFGNVTRSKRSKIGSFIKLVKALDEVIQFPSAISEKLGLTLIREMDRNANFIGALQELLQSVQPSNAEIEMNVLSTALAEIAELPGDFTPPSISKTSALQKKCLINAPNKITTIHVSTGIKLRFIPRQNQIEIKGDAVSNDMVDILYKWLRSNFS